MWKQSERQPAALLVGMTLVALACGGGGGGSGPPPDAMTIEAAAVSGNEQAGRVGEPLAAPIVVAVTEDGQPAPDVTVSWTTTSGGELTPASGATDAGGVASSTWTLGTAIGAQTARATVSGASGSPVTFTAMALSGLAATIEKAGGDGQTGEINTPLTEPVQARVGDEFGNAVDGVAVNWSATGAAVSAPTVMSDAAGVSQVVVTLGGAAGAITIIAEAVGLTGSPLAFNAIAVVPTPPPGNIAITVGNDFFRSDRNSSINPAVDTLAVGGTATWTWAATAVTHNVTSTGSPGFSSSTTKSAPASHSFTFSATGVYRYYCTIHASPSTQAGMVGRIVVK